MPKPWRTIDARETAEGTLELRALGNHEFVITIAGAVLMTSAGHQSEDAVGALGCEPLRDCVAPRVLTAGLGLGYTLRAALDVLPASAHVRVAELNPVVLEWCRGPVAHLAGHVLDDSRVVAVVGDVMDSVRDAAAGRIAAFDAIVVDLYVGPGCSPAEDDEPLYGREAIKLVHEALRPGGIYAVWGEEFDAAFLERLQALDFHAEALRPRTGGPRHVVYIARR